MDEVVFRNLCTPTVHYLLIEEQTIYSTQQSIPGTLSKICPTYVHLIVQLEDHWAAVQKILLFLRFRNFIDIVDVIVSWIGRSCG